ncbi:hypothetical protein AO1008_06477 [Aspergillus oryzae 100-8]|uniref:Uncharacterized protein n=1 Tax=Aspergillus oryzae (strain 3.042) TaxID=1160506 RepID=I8IJ18_ASPO3|nr:hypothetical protein Ao3042_04788 [Aspergillus oryzae 3.042]KDE79997.1 hypothetical protein AO1008_06477 [Aspergillus oryzae 100-8]|eukprot:EIT78766.1 hypothetical protein Ao3042_04788 [Aspergillus oryzae 3.042]
MGSFPKSTGNVTVWYHYLFSLIAIHPLRKYPFFFLLFSLFKHLEEDHCVITTSSTFPSLRDTSYAPILVLRETIDNRNILHGREQSLHFLKIFPTVRQQPPFSFPVQLNLLPRQLLPNKIHTK